jgi:flagellar biosynthesis protein FlhB
MADQDKTEKATPKKRKDARKKGQVAKSTELNGVVVLMAGLISIMFLGSKVINGMASAMRVAWADIANPANVTSGVGLHGLLEVVLHTMESTVAPIFAITIAAALIANIAQIGLRPSGKALKPNFSRLSPLAGFKRVFGKRIAVELGKALAKIAVVGAVAAMTLVPMLTNLSASVGTTPMALGDLLGSNAESIIMRCVIAYLLIGILDLIYQRRSFSKNLKMTKHEVKEEWKSTQLPPEVKSAQRRRMIQQLRARMMAAVPTADVVITNPTHYAVALRYDGTAPAPIVVAKGKNHVAAQIRRIAAENDVPIVPDPPLARSLHAMVEIDQQIPSELYAAVAQVLAYVYKMAGRRRIAA